MCAIIIMLACAATTGLQLLRRSSLLGSTTDNLLQQEDTNDVAMCGRKAQLKPVLLASVLVVGLPQLSSSDFAREAMLLVVRHLPPPQR
eukprot:COSAG01_NODE_6360_length_3713_cov_3.531821_4_plen_89_part_00